MMLKKRWQIKQNEKTREDAIMWKMTGKPQGEQGEPHLHTTKMIKHNHEHCQHHALEEPIKCATCSII
jgi:hypothetical protein